nr:MAG TPA: hypothetical protein [Caudoviricetes sp.]
MRKAPPRWAGPGLVMSSAFCFYAGAAGLPDDEKRGQDDI